MENVTNQLNNMVEDLVKIQMQNITVVVSFPLKGHTVVVQGMNPDAVFKAVEVIKANNKILTQIKKK